MPAPRLLLYSDVFDHIKRWCDLRGHSAGNEMAKQAIVNGYEEVAGFHDWSFLMRPRRIQLHAPQTTGSIAYTHSGGAYERMVTLTGSTWPDWAVDGAIRFESASGNDIVSRVATVESTTVLTLDANMCPAADVAAGAEYTIWQEYYILWSDFASVVSIVGESNWTEMDPAAMPAILQLNKWNDTTGDSRYYCIAEAPDLFGSLAIYVWPPIESDETIELIIKREPRVLRYSGQDHALEYKGTVTVTAGNATVTGLSTAFEADMVNSIFRLSRNTNRPTSHEGANPFVAERSIEAVGGTLLLTADSAFGASYSGVKYQISDSIDLEHSVHPALLACAEKHAGEMLGLDDKKLFPKAVRALRVAASRDKRIHQRRISGSAPYTQRRLGTYPYDATVTE